jgi:hypothetical protein
MHRSDREEDGPDRGRGPSAHARGARSAAAPCRRGIFLVTRGRNSLHTGCYAPDMRSSKRARGSISTAPWPRRPQRRRRAGQRQVAQSLRATAPDRGREVAKGNSATTSVVVPAKAGPITTGLRCYAQASPQRAQKERPGVMGPGSRFRLRSSSYGGQLAWPGRRSCWCLRPSTPPPPASSAGSGRRRFRPWPPSLPGVSAERSASRIWLRTCGRGRRIFSCP